MLGPAVHNSALTSVNLMGAEVRAGTAGDWRAVDPAVDPAVGADAAP